MTILKAPGVPLFKAPGVPAFGLNCCCGECDPDDYPDLPTCQYYDSSGNVQNVPNLFITITEDFGLGFAGTYEIECGGEEQVVLANEDFSPMVSPACSPVPIAGQIWRRDIRLSLSDDGGLIESNVRRNNVLQPMFSTATKSLYTRSFSTVILCGVPKKGPPIYTHNTDPTSPATATRPGTTPSTISMDTHVTCYFGFDIRLVTTS